MKNKLIVMALLGMMSLNASDSRKRALGADVTLAALAAEERAEEARQVAARRSTKKEIPGLKKLNDAERLAASALLSICKPKSKYAIEKEKRSPEEELRLKEQRKAEYLEKLAAMTPDQLIKFRREKADRNARARANRSREELLIESVQRCEQRRSKIASKENNASTSGLVE
jgi:hypothetical protein